MGFCRQNSSNRYKLPYYVRNFKWIFIEEFLYLHDFCRFQHPVLYFLLRKFIIFGHIRNLRIHGLIEYLVVRILEYISYVSCDLSGRIIFCIFPIYKYVPLGMIVTVSGTGSEMNGGAVITNEELKIKTGRDYPKCNARFALMDPTYTFSVPKMQMISGGFDTLSHIMEIYFSEPDEPNVSDDIAEALMRGVVRDLRAAVQKPEDYTARSNLMWEATMAENRVIKLGKQTDFQAHMMEHQLGAYTDCNHGLGLAVLHPAYYRYICEKGITKFARFATRVWDVPADGKTEIELAHAGVEALADFIQELGMPTTLRELGVTELTPMKELADSVPLTPGSYGKLTHEDVLHIFEACY